MALIDCPECGIEISHRAQFCPRCGAPNAHGRRRTREEHGSFKIPMVPLTGLDVVKSIVGRLALATAFFASGVGFDAPPVILGSLILAGSCAPLYLKARRAERRGLAGLGPAAADLEDRVEQRLLETEDRIARELAEADRGTVRLADLEERLEFMERLLAREREERESQGRAALPPG